MERTLEYRGFKGSWNYNKHEFFYYGKIEGINDLVTYESGIDNFHKTFEEAVDDYIETKNHLQHLMNELNK